MNTLTKVLSSEKPKQSAVVMDKNGKILNDKESKTKWWLEHFTKVLNRENPNNPVSEMKIELPDEIEEIDASEPSRAEVRKAIGHLKMEKRQVSTTYKQSCLKLALIMLPLKPRRSWT